MVKLESGWFKLIEHNTHCLGKIEKTLMAIMEGLENTIFRTRWSCKLESNTTSVVEEEYKSTSLLEDSKKLVKEITGLFIILLLFRTIYTFQSISFSLFGYIDKIDTQEISIIIRIYSYFWQFFIEFVFWFILSIIIIANSINYLGWKNLLWLTYIILLTALTTIITYVFYFGLKWFMNIGIDVYNKSLPNNSGLYFFILGSYILIMSIYSFLQIFIICKNIIRCPLLINIIDTFFLGSILCSLIACALTFKLVAILPSYTNSTSIA